MSMVEQKFSALDSFAGTYRIEFYMYAGQYSITVNLQWSTGRHETADDALTEALRYLRKINKTPKPMTNAQEPAFPVQPTFNSDGQICDERFKLEGLTKREYFAGLAMQAILSNPHDGQAENQADERCAAFAVQCADKLLKQLEKTP